MPSIAVFGAGFDPPCTAHVRLIERLAERHDEVIVVPYGPRPDRPELHQSAPIHRAFLADLAFAGMPRVVVDLFDLEQRREFTRAVHLEERYASRGRVSHVVDADWVRGGRAGTSMVQAIWKDGRRLWAMSHFTVVHPPGQPPDPADLPPHHDLIPGEPFRVSDSVRDLVYHSEPISDLVPLAVAEYVQRYRLYRGGACPREILWKAPTPPRLHVVAGPQPASVAEAARLMPLEGSPPDLIVVAGGDGTMLHAIRDHWRMRVPFYGVNTGHVGFLLNGAAEGWRSEVLLYQLPLLWVETVGLDGAEQSVLAFNDAWVERATGQTAWIEVAVDGKVRLPKVVADGMLVATAAGSTSYARAMGATPVPFNVPLLTLAGSNVLVPMRWRPVVLPLDTEIRLTTLDPVKRPLHGYIDGVTQGAIREMRVRVSQTAAVELAFTRDHDPVEKLAEHQFPLH